MNNYKTIHLKDYHAADYLVDTIDLTFDVISTSEVLVTNISKYRSNNSHANQLVLNAQVSIKSIHLNDVDITNTVSINQDRIVILVPQEFVLKIVTILNPSINKSCEGLYIDGSNTLLTQCEPQGFQHITAYQDRPDVMAVFTTTIIATPDLFTTMLSNGNLIKDEIITVNGTQKRLVVWNDPFKKPCYLFALVVGNLSVLKSTYTTKLGKSINLFIYTEKHLLDKCSYAMESLKNAMRWDEDRFGLEFDLDNYMIVATSSFNMGAMENKGLNIFNTKYILATPESATDDDYINVESVIGHEYFHNWSGNRVTCRDWFQLSLKEGLTVFRDQEFTADMNDAVIKRISDVKVIKQQQFSEDNGPLSHPVRPESYIEINNFYTLTVYDKGAEVVRMYQTILGTGGFNKGLALYLQRHDGQAVTCEDFYQAMMDANQVSYPQFMLWYSQNGTPLIDVHEDYDNGRYALHFKQSNSIFPNYQPMLIPIAIELLDCDGNAYKNLNIEGGSFTLNSDNNLVLLLDNYHNTFIFSNLETKPIPSLLRNFSAPVKLNFRYTKQERLALARHDTDHFNRFIHLNELLSEEIIKLYNLILEHTNPEILNANNYIALLDKNTEYGLRIHNITFSLHINQLLNTMRYVLNSHELSNGLKSLMLTMPSFGELSPIINNVNPIALNLSIDLIASIIGDNLLDAWMEHYNILLLNKLTRGDRSLKNLCFNYIIKALSLKIDTSFHIIETISLGHYSDKNMTECFASLVATKNLNSHVRQHLLDSFYKAWKLDENVIDKWFLVQATSVFSNTEKIVELMSNESYIFDNPNKIYALLRAFTQNVVMFHNVSGYQFIANQVIEVDKFNSHVASTLANGFSSVVYLNHTYKNMAKPELQRILQVTDISKAVFEITSKILDSMI